MRRGKCVHLKRGQIIVVGGMVIEIKSCSSGRVETYIFGDGKIYMPGDVDRTGLRDVKEIAEYYERMSMDKTAMSANDKVQRNDSSDRRGNDATQRLAGPTDRVEGHDDPGGVQG